MSEPIEVIVEAKADSQSGMITFDGTIVEFFGFRKVESTRVHVRQVKDVEVSFESGLLSTPMFSITGRHGSLGCTQGIEPKEEIKPELENLAEAIRKAASRYPEASF